MSGGDAAQETPDTGWQDHREPEQIAAYEEHLSQSVDDDIPF